MPNSSQFKLTLVYASVVLYAVCYMAQAPLLPYLTKQFGGDDMSYGWLQSAFSMLQFLGGLLSGPFVDRYGGKLLLVTSYAVSAVCYLLTAAATNMTMLYISRIATLMQHAVLAARTIVTAHTSGESRAAGLGYVGAAYGVGFAIGPALGGWISSSSLQATAWVSGVASLVGMGLLMVLLPSDQAPSTTARTKSADQPAATAATKSLQPASASTAKPEATPGAAAGPQQPAGNLMSFWTVVMSPGVPELLLFKAGTGLCLSLLSSTFSLVLQQRYSLTSQQNGWVLSYLGGCMVLAQATLIKPSQRILGQGGAAVAGCALMAVAFLAMSAAGSLWHLLACVAPLAAGATVLATVNTAQLTQAVPSTLSGTVVAVDMSLGSAVRMAAPLLGVKLLQRVGWPPLCGLLGSVLGMLATAAWLLLPSSPQSKAYKAE